MKTQSYEIYYPAIKNSVMQKLTEKVCFSKGKVLDVIDETIESYEHENSYIIPLRRKIELRKVLSDAVCGFGILQELLDDQDITEIMINGANHIFVEKKGHILKYDKAFESEEQLEEIIQKIVSSVNRIVNETTPIVDARLEDGSRVNAVIPPVALDGPTLTIRKFPEKFSMDRMIQVGSITEECAKMLKTLVECRYNIFISGGTGAGKTTFLNALSEYIPQKERVITIEDSAELKISLPNLVRMEARNANMEGKNAITIRDLIRTALRMRPDRIIVGEVRSEECIDMLSAMNTGHDGSLSTGHANGTKDMLSRMETMVLMGMDLPLNAVRAQIASAVDILIHLERFRDGSRKVVSVEEVTGCYDDQICTRSLFIYDYKADILKKTDNELLNNEKLAKTGR